MSAEYPVKSLAGEEPLVISMDSGDTPARGLSAFLLAASSIWQREMIRFFRQPSRMIGAFGSPLLFWLLIGSGLGTSFRPLLPIAAPDGGNVHYLQYFFPGTLLLILLFTAIFSTISLIEDRREGFLQAVLIAPVSRGSLVLGKILGGTCLAVIQGLLFLLAAPFAGVPIHAMTGFAVAAASFLVAFGLTGLGFMLAWRMESTQGFHGVMNLLLIPMWLLSGALFPDSGASGWVQILMQFNPLTYCLQLLRAAVFNLPEGSQWPVNAIAVSIAFAIVTFALSWAMACRTQKKVS